MITLGTPDRGINHQPTYNAKAIELNSRRWFDVELNESGQVQASSVATCALTGTAAYEGWLRKRVNFVVIREGQEAA